MPATLLDRRPDEAAPGGSLPPRPAVEGWLRRDHVVAQFARFVLVGGSANVVYVGLFLGLAGFGAQAANLVAVVASTALANELHRRVTFRAGDRTGWAAAQWAGGSLAAVGLAVSALTLAAVEVWTASASPVLSITAVIAVNGLVGLARFAGLRWVLVVRPVPAAGVARVRVS